MYNMLKVFQKQLGRFYVANLGNTNTNF